MHRSTFLPLQHAATLIFSVDWGLVNEPETVWADEPTGDLDSETAQEIMDLVLDLNQRNRQTFIIVTHAPEIGEQCNRIVRMRDGYIESDGNGAK